MSKQQGMYFAADDYVGFWPRLVILVVDSLIILVWLILVTFAYNLLLRQQNLPSVYLVLVVGGVWWYETLLKRSRFGTLGYWLMGCKIVNLQGERPSLFMLTFRALLWMIGPFNILFDLLWCGIDEDRQTLRDRFSSTCLVKRNAQPIGTGSVKFAHFFAAGFNLVYPHVAHPKTPAPSPDAKATANE